MTLEADPFKNERRELFLGCLVLLAIVFTSLIVWTVILTPISWVIFG